MDWRPFFLPARTTIGIPDVCGDPFKCSMSWCPSILGICKSVMMMSGRKCTSISTASAPLVADSTRKPRSSKKRQTACRISMESSTTNTLGIIETWREVGKKGKTTIMAVTGRFKQKLSCYGYKSNQFGEEYGDFRRLQAGYCLRWPYP